MRKDWKEIKTYYITDPAATLRSTAQKFGVCMSTLASKSKKEGWYAERKKVQNRIIAKSITKTENRLARELSKEAEFLDRMKGHVDRMLRDADQFNRHLVETRVVDEDGGMTVDTEERIYEKVDSRALKDTMQVLQMMEAMTRSLYNVQKAEAIQKARNERERLDIEKERLELERERSALRSQMSGSDGDTNWGIVLIPEVKSDGE
jgi:hypothetical protein